MRDTPTDATLFYLALSALVALLVGCPNVSLYDFDGDGHPDSTDCAPEDPNVYPDAPDPEGDGIDSDCDGVDGELVCDADGDGYVNELCGGNDCDDNDPLVNASMEEVCDGKDTDCDGDLPPGEVDLDMDGAAVCEGDCDDSSVVYNILDEDGDGYTTCDLLADCDDHNELLTPADLDFDGYSTCTGDCDDLAGLIHPLADELCDGFDTDCDGEVPVEEADGDGDGHAACADCDDGDSEAWGWDEDGDGFDPCEGDCDETSTSVYPGAFDAWGDGDDLNCDGTDGTDADGDGYPGDADEAAAVWDCDDADAGLNRDDVDGDSVDTCGGDCDDADATRWPGNTEDACDGLDTDCIYDANEVDDDGDGWAECAGDCDDTDPAMLPVDGDGDGWTLCDDCDDGDPGIFPTNPEACDGIDVDCVFDPEEVDDDGDGWRECEGDCSDANAALHPYDSDGDGVDDACGWRDIGLGLLHSCAIDSDDAVQCWGIADGSNSDYGQVSGAPAGVFGQVTSGRWNNCAIDSSGTILCWGRNDDGQSSPPEGVFSEIAGNDGGGSGEFACGVKAESWVGTPSGLAQADARRA